MNSPTRFIRQNILDLEPYSTARDEFKGGDISVWLDANESPYQNGVNRYPDPHQNELKKRVSEYYGVSKESIFLGGAGSDEAIDLTFRIFCEPRVDSAIAITPSYGVYKVAAQINDIALREVELNPDFSLPVNRILKEVSPSTKLIWICSPNNPTGNAFPKNDILSIAENFNGIVVVDEAYADFSGKGSVVNEIEEHSNIIVLRTFSKAWGMAGLRCGIAIAVPEIITYFDRVKYPYNMSSLIQQELLRRIDEKTVRNHVEEIISERDEMASRLSETQCVRKIYPSDANFLLIEVSDANRVYDFMIENGVIVRNRTKMPLCKNCLRVTVGTPEENKKIIQLFEKFRK